MQINHLIFLTLLSDATGKVYFKETFDIVNQDRWVQSEWKKSVGQQGSFSWSNDGFIKTEEDSKFYSASAQYESFSNKDTPLIVQYSVKASKDVECGGAYVKLGPKQEDPSIFGDPTPYNIMFGPDKCGMIKKTHLIFSYKGKNLLKKTELPYMLEDGMTHLYRLTLSPDNTCLVDIDGKNVFSGSLEEEWDFLPPKQIPDPSIPKPSDWVDKEYMEDPEDVKPDDWVDAKEVQDVKATQPDDWDVEEDGEWVAPMIPNLAYKGEWRKKNIKNPAYKGPWVPNVIPNPSYEFSSDLYLYNDFSFVGFDIWQVKAGTFFDDLIITDKSSEADILLQSWELVRDREIIAGEEIKKNMGYGGVGDKGHDSMGEEDLNLDDEL